MYQAPDVYAAISSATPHSLDVVDFASARSAELSSLVSLLQSKDAGDGGGGRRVFSPSPATSAAALNPTTSTASPTASALPPNARWRAAWSASPPPLPPAPPSPTTGGSAAALPTRCRRTRTGRRGTCGWRRTSGMRSGCIV